MDERALPLACHAGVYILPGSDPAAVCGASPATALLFAPHGLNNPSRYTDPTGHSPCAGANYDDGPQCIKKNPDAYDRKKHPYHFGEDPNNMEISEDGIEFIKDWEKFVPYPYDNDGSGSCTIGYGTLIHAGACNGQISEQEFTNGITEEKAEQLLFDRINDAEETVRKNVTMPLKQQEFDALVSFAYNVGPGFGVYGEPGSIPGFSNSNVLDEVNVGNFEAVPDALGMWKYPLSAPGLITRRYQEGMMFIHGIYDATH